MSRKRGRIETSEYAGFARRVLRAYGKRVAEEGDEPELADLIKMRIELDAAIQTAVDGMRSRGSDISWSRIGSAVGISRQAAWERWGKARKAA